MPEFLGRLRNKGHRLIARWGEEILLENSDDQKTWSSISGWEQWQWQRAKESCQKWKPQTSLTGNVISWNLGPMHLSAALPYIAQTMQKGDAVILLQEVLIRKGTTVKVRRKLRHMFPILILIAFISGNSSLEPLIEGLCAQIHVNLS